MNATPRPTARVWLLLGAIAMAACTTVHLDGPPAEVNACRPSQMFFVERIWPEFLAQSYNGQSCGGATCHDPVSGRALRVLMPTSPPTFPFPAQSDWETSYLSVTQQLNCSSVLGSELYTRPAGLRSQAHPRLIDPDGPEAVLLEQWVAASP